MQTKLAHLRREQKRKIYSVASCLSTLLLKYIKQIYELSDYLLLATLRIF